ncbi:hypothetical protein L873DRAFT_212855 [Choiromyces venosus 120613-1]|uniref:Uncharacterized protein n=1 Tax=Choiromyces venosus 120613-1 TaxID=1336337 RepID=A0A3N4J6T8_9PEZI|nr:hypothetical protein L873DRAFT_212855 [Choiromyces venosus 120613-1]
MKLLIDLPTIIPVLCYGRARKIASTVWQLQQDKLTPARIEHWCVHFIPRWGICVFLFFSFLFFSFLFFSSLLFSCLSFSFIYSQHKSVSAHWRKKGKKKKKKALFLCGGFWQRGLEEREKERGGWMGGWPILGIVLGKPNPTV